MPTLAPPHPHDGLAYPSLLPDVRVPSDPAELREMALIAGAELDAADAEDVLAWAIRTFGSSFVIASSMAEAILIDMASKIEPDVNVAFLDTGYHFAETSRHPGRRRAHLSGQPVHDHPGPVGGRAGRRVRPRLYERDPDLCCKMRKVEPLNRALAGYTAWASGIRREETRQRRYVSAVDWDARRQMVKINPLARWTQGDVDAYVAEHGVVVNPLLFDGYPSIGCAPCTRRIAAGEDARAGRWAGFAKTECGLHS